MLISPLSPSLNNLSPADYETAVADDNNIVLTFSKTEATSIDFSSPQSSRKRSEKLNEIMFYIKVKLATNYFYLQITL
tara:strand:- start:54 stop:287 length:234 start_codon:yes stop_codon:yes gene_type:complete